MEPNSDTKGYPYTPLSLHQKYDLLNDEFKTYRENVGNYLMPKIRNMEKEYAEKKKEYEEMESKFYKSQGMTIQKDIEIEQHKTMVDEYKRMAMDANHDLALFTASTDKKIKELNDTIINNRNTYHELINKTNEQSAAIVTLYSTIKSYKTLVDSLTEEIKKSKPRRSPRGLSKK